ncbi:MAG: hypothetical protein WD651_05750 [Acidimicrobiia bacterium]
MTETKQSPNQERSERLIEEMRVLIVAGIPVGMLVAGVGSRLAMLLLRVTSPDFVVGLTSDDGFTIGQVTVAGTYNLLLLGAAVGIIGAGAYKMVAPWLIGPTWFRRLTTGLGSAAVVGSMLVHAGGIDFTVLKPTWLAIGLFVALPGVFGTVIGSAVDAVGEPDSWTAQGRRRWLLPLIAVGCFPFTVLFLFFALVIVGFWVVVEPSPTQRLRRIPVFRHAARSVWLLIAIAGLVALVRDIEELM